MVNVGKHTIRGCYGILITCPAKKWRLDQKRLICCSRKKYGILCLKCMCLAVIFQGIYIYVYVICIHIYSIYWIDHPLTNTSTWRASKRDCPYSKYIYIYNDMYIYIYNCHPGWWRIVSYRVNPRGIPFTWSMPGDFTQQPCFFLHEAVVFESTSPGFPERRETSRSTETETTGRNGLGFPWEIFPVELGVRLRNPWINWKTGEQMRSGVWPCFFLIGKIIRSLNEGPDWGVGSTPSILPNSTFFMSQKSLDIQAPPVFHLLRGSLGCVFGIQIPSQKVFGCPGQSCWMGI